MTSLNHRTLQVSAFSCVIREIQSEINITEFMLLTFHYDHRYSTAELHLKKI